MTAENSKHMQVKEPDFNLLLQLTLYTSSITISYQRMSAGTSFSVISSCAISTKGAIARVTKRLALFSGEPIAGNKIADLIGGTVIVT